MHRKQHVARDALADNPYYVSDKDERSFVGQVLKQAGLAAPDDHQWDHAKSTALNTKQQWLRIDRGIIFHRDGKTHTASSIIDPAVRLQGSYAAKQLNAAGLQGISAHTPHRPLQRDRAGPATAQDSQESAAFDPVGRRSDPG